MKTLSLKSPPWFFYPIVSVAIVPTGHMLLQAAAGKFIEIQSFLTSLILLILLVILYTILHVRREIESLKLGQGIEVCYLPCGPGKTSGTYEFIRDKVSAIPEGEKTHIMALNSFLEAIQEPDEEGNTMRLKYYNALINKTTNYTRILQVKLDENIVARIQKGYAEHYTKMLEKHDNECFTVAKLAPAVFPFSFLLVETEEAGSMMFFQIDKHMPHEASKKFCVSGYFYISDPQEVITPKFKQLFRAVDINPSTRVLTKADLDKLQQSQEEGDGR